MNNSTDAGVHYLALNEYCTVQYGFPRYKCCTARYSAECVTQVIYCMVQYRAVQGSTGTRGGSAMHMDLCYYV